MQSKFFPPYLRQAAEIYMATSHSVVRQETIEISEQRTAFVWFFAQEVDWCMKDCDKQRLQTTVSINLWKILAGHTGDWFDVKTASICTTELWDALKSFILTSLKFKVAPYPIIVSLDTLRQDPLDLSFWSFLTFLHYGIEEVKRHLLWKFYKKIRRKRWSNVPPKLVACIGFLYKVVHKIGRLRKFNSSRGI